MVGVLKSVSQYVGQTIHNIMKNEDKIFTREDIYRLSFCVIVLFLVFILPKIDLYPMFVNFLVLLRPNMDHYPYANPPIFFSIGEALSSIAILFAIYQFKKEKWSIALRIRSYIEPTIFICIILGITLSLVASVVTFFYPTNIFLLSVFWQIISSLFIAFSIVFLFLKATNIKLFNKNNSRKFYEVMVGELSRPSPQRLDVTLEALLDNFQNICTAANGDRESEVSKSSIAILDVVLGESSLVELLVTKRLDALRHLIYIIEKNNINQRQAPGFQVIVRNLFLNEESFFYRHLNRDGLSLSSNIYESIFEYPKILTNFNLFGYPTLGYLKRNDSRVGLKVFIQALSKAIETYLKTGNVPTSYINNGLEYLSEAFGNICTKISLEESRGVDTKNVLSEEWWILYDIANFLGHDYIFIAYEDDLNQDVIRNERATSEASFHSTSTINAGIAAVLFKSFEQLSHITKTVDTYYIVLELLGGVMQGENYKEGYRDPFEKRMWEQIAKNVIGKHYPNVLRPYLTFIGFTLSSEDNNQRTGWVGEQTERMRRLLYIDLKPLFDNEERMVNDKLMKDILLPDSMDYIDGKFLYVDGFGKGERRIISEPAPGSKSALEGVDTQTRSLL
jgi:hypothetical protein